MSKSGIRLVMLDVDGTIINSPEHRTVPQELCETIRCLAREGIFVGLASGRNYGHLMSQLGHIGFTGPYICNNGGILVMNDRIVSETVLSREVIQAVIRQSQEMGYMVEFSGRETMYTYQPHGYAGFVFPREGDRDYLRILDGSQEAFSHLLEQPISKLTLLADSQDKAEKISSFWRNSPLRQEAALTSSFWFCQELVHPSVSKGAALREIAQRMGIPLEQVLAIGDGDNDVQMLETAGISFAMENASPAARKAGKYTAPSVAQNGAGYVLEHYVLRGEPLPARNRV